MTEPTPSRARTRPGAPGRPRHAAPSSSISTASSANARRLQATLDRARDRASGRTPRPTRASPSRGSSSRPGARGLTVGTLGEAEVFAAAGIDDLFLAYPVWADGAEGRPAPRAPRRRSTAFRSGSTRWPVPSGSRRRSPGRRGPLPGLVELDPGNHRTGVGVAADVRSASPARPRPRPGGRRRLHPRRPRLRRPGAAAAAGATRSGPSTAAADGARAAAGFDVESSSARARRRRCSTRRPAPVTEIRAGTYLLGDRQQWLLGAIPAEGCAVAVAATVVARPSTAGSSSTPARRP